MATFSRTKRIAEEIRKVIGNMLISGIKDPRINSMVSVTEVEVTSDLSYAYVYVSILGGDEEESLEGLKSASNFLIKKVNSNLHEEDFEEDSNE